MSAEKIATIRQVGALTAPGPTNWSQRLAEGRRLLRTRSESEDLARSGLGGPECITAQVILTYHKTKSIVAYIFVSESVFAPYQSVHSVIVGLSQGGSCQDSSPEY